MRPIDWIVLIGTLVTIVAYGVWKGRHKKNLDGYLLAGRQLQWPTIALSIMATQASAITFLSTPGQAYADGMRFVQFYLGLPIAMVLLAIVAVPIYHHLKVYTAYEYLETRFGPKTRGVTAALFLAQRGVSTGLTVYAPAVIVSLLLGWNIHATNIGIGLLVVAITVGGTKAVSRTHVHQLLIALAGMAVALTIAIHSLPNDVSIFDALHVAGRMGRLNAIDFSFDLKTPYNFWSGMIGGTLLMLSYFGCDQSQVQRYLTGETVEQSRLGLLINGMIKVPMQFFILFVGAMVFVFFQFTAPPLFFNTAARARVATTRYEAQYAALERTHVANFAAKRAGMREMLVAMHAGDRVRADAATASVRALQTRDADTHKSASVLIGKADPAADTNDTNYVFLSFVIGFFPAGVVGLLLAAIFCAAMSATASGLNSLASTSVVDVYRRFISPDANDHECVRMSKILTVFWGLVSIGVGEFASHVGSLIEAVNRFGSFFYGTILGVFVLAFFFRTVGDVAAVSGAIVGQIAVALCASFTNTAYLWWNAVGCVVGVVAALVIQGIRDDGRGLRDRDRSTASA
ncbi:MAG TPA: sodium:solute symporter [Thermoanaerobaculia bacterium]|jgi:SSS family solute:Na+ symporter|nr:sodium:solute symporter [Thermoanaerobaculia bacterium]